MSFIDKVDFLSYSPSLLVNGNTRIKTTLGGILSLVIIAVTLMSTYFFSMDLVMRKNPLVSFNKYFSENEKFVLTKDSFFLLFGLKMNGSIDLDEPRRFFEAKALRYYYRTVTKDDGTAETLLETTPVPVRPCTREDVAKYEEYKAMPVEKFYCLDDDASVEMFAPLGGAFDNSYLNLYLRPCQADVAAREGFECASKEEFEEMLPNTSVFMRFETYFADHDSFENPIKSYFETIYQHNSGHIYNRTFMNFGKLDYYTDRGVLVEDVQKLEYFSFQSRTFTQYEMKEQYKAIKQTFHQITVTFSGLGLHDSYRRSYKKIQNIMADIGGFSKGCMVLAYLLNYLFSKGAFFKMVFSDYFLSYSKESGSVIQANNLDASCKLELQDKMPSKGFKIGSNCVRKVNIDSFSVMKALICARNSSNSKRIKEVVASYERLMDVRTLISNTQKLEMLRGAVLSGTERAVFDSLSFLLDLNTAPKFVKSEQKSKKFELMSKKNSLEDNIVDKFFVSDEAQLQNYMLK